MLLGPLSRLRFLQGAAAGSSLLLLPRLARRAGAAGRLHGFDNLYCMDGGVMPTGSGYNPALTLIALALRATANVADPGNPERRLGSGPLS